MMDEKKLWPYVSHSNDSHSHMLTAIASSGITFKDIQQQWSFWQIIKELTLYLSPSKQHTQVSLSFIPNSHVQQFQQKMFENKKQIWGNVLNQTSDHVDNYAWPTLERKKMEEASFALSRKVTL